MATLFPSSSACKPALPWKSTVAGLLTGLVIIFSWPKMANWWPGDLIRIYQAMPNAIGLWGTQVGNIPAMFYGELLLAGFVLGLCNPGFCKLPIIAWALHNDPAPRTLFNWLLRGWGLQCGFLVLVFCRLGFLAKVSLDTLLWYSAFFNYICYIATLVVALLLVSDGWRLTRNSAIQPRNLQLPLIFALGFYLPGQISWMVIIGWEYDDALLQWLLLAPVMVGILCAYFATGAIAYGVRHLVGEAGCRTWRGHIALFIGMVVLCIAVNTIVRIVIRLVS